MGSPADGFVRLLEAPDAVEAELARNLLGSVGIPSMLHGQDRDLAELGQASHMRISRPDLYVPAEDLDRARTLLDETWDRSALTEEMAVDAPSAEPASRPIPRAAWKFLFVAGLVVAILLTCQRLLASRSS
jgi:hypothetical protein